MSTKTNQNKIFFLLLCLGVLYLSFKVLSPYILLTTMAFLVASLYSPIHRRILSRVKSIAIANALSIAIIFISILTPFLFVAYLSYNQVLEFNRDIQVFLKLNNIEIKENSSDEEEEAEELKPTEEQIKTSDPNAIGQIDLDRLIKEVNKLIDKTPVDQSYELTREDVNNFIGEVVGPASNILAKTALDIGGSTLDIITNVLVFVILLSTIFSSHDKILNYYKKISPLDDKIDDMYIKRLTVMGTSMIKGVFVIATLQGLISGLFLYIAGVDYVVFWTLVSIVVSIIPLGAGIVNIPIAIVLILTGNVWKGVMIILGNVIIVGNIDSILRPKLVAKEAELPSALVLLGALGGVQFFGILGFIYGPIVMIILKTTLEVYVAHYKNS